MLNPSRRWSLRAPLCAALLCAGLFALGCDGRPSSAGHVIQVEDPQATDPLGVLYALPPYTLTASDGQPFSSETLKGRPYVATFFFTRCTTMCPPLMRAAKALREALDAEGLHEVQVVSFSVDPEHDTPGQLRGYASRLGLDLSRWTLLTGPLKEMTALITGSFKLHVGAPATDAQGMMDIAHTGHLVLVDRQGRIRKFISTSESPSGVPYRNRADAVPDAMVLIRELVRRGE